MYILARKQIDGTEPMEGADNTCCHLSSANWAQHRLLSMSETRDAEHGRHQISNVTESPTVESKTPCNEHTLG